MEKEKMNEMVNEKENKEDNRKKPINPFYDMPKEHKSHWFHVCIFGACVFLGIAAIYTAIWLLGI